MTINAQAARRREITIIGSACRFPGGVTSPSKLWDLIRDPYELAEPIPPDRFSALGFYHENEQYHGHFNVKEAYFLAGFSRYCASEKPYVSSRDSNKVMPKQ